MAESPSQDVATNTTVPIEIVSEEEMAFLEAALAATRSSSCIIPAILSPSRSLLFQENARSIRTITSLSKRRLIQSDIEDLGDSKSTQKKNRAADSFYLKFRKKNGLSVTDITSTEWCQKQMELVLQYGKKKMTKPMKAGHDRHVKLEEEVVKKVRVIISSAEDAWALKFLNFITGANQLLFEGLTREIPVVGYLEGVWMVGIIDEIRIPEGENKNPLLVDTKTRKRDTLPAEPQKRNGRLQLMCYKKLWDNLVADKFPFKSFFEFFSLDPHYVLSKEIRENTANAGIPAETLDEIVRYFRTTCKTLLPADNEMLLRYEWQNDYSVIGEDLFAYDPDWLNSQIHECLEFWLGEREASFVPEEERWKCHHCQYASKCPLNDVSATSSSAESISLISSQS